MRSKKSLLRLVLGLVSSLAAPSVWAQESQEGGLLEEVTVTAQRRVEAAQDVPIAITAFNAEQLTALGVTDALDLTKLVPNLMGHNNTGPGTSNNYALRALNNTESIATFDAPVGTYVDDMYIARQNANNLTLFDVDRVEILRGPQGTLFGRNTTGGAVSVIVKKPNSEAGGFMEMGFGQFGRFNVRGSIDIPASERVRTKLSAFWVKEDGYVTNVVTGETLNGEENVGVRGALSFDVTDSTTWDLALTWTDTKDTNLINFESGGHRFIRTGLSSSGTPFAGFIVGDKQNFPLQNNAKVLMLTSNVAIETAAGNWSFITGGYDLKQKFALDFSVPGSFNPALPNPGPRGGFAIVNDGRHKQITQEIKFDGKAWGDRLDYVAGVYYFKEDNDTDFADVAGNFVLADRTLQNTTKAYAAYVQGDWKFTDRWTMTVGLRYTDETKEIGYVSNGNTRILGGAAAGTRCSATVLVCESTTANLVTLGIPTELKVDLLTPRLGFKFALNDDVNFYYSSTRGFKSGGWNARSATAGGILPFKPEKVWSHEIGMKSDLLDGRLRVNLTAFRMDVDDFQLPSAFTPPGATAPTFLTQNFAGLENTGVEAEFIWQPVKDFNVLLNLGVQDAKYVDHAAPVVAQRDRCRLGLGGGAAPGLTVVQTITGNCGIGIVNLAGEYSQPTRAPEFSGVLFTSYTFNTDRFKITPSLTIHKIQDINVATSELPPAQTIVTGTPPNTVTRVGLFPGAKHPGWTEVGYGVSLAPQDGPWSITASCTNCSNKLEVVSSFLGLYYNDPRTWNVSLRYDFE